MAIRLRGVLLVTLVLGVTGCDSDATPESVDTTPSTGATDVATLDRPPSEPEPDRAESAVRLTFDVDDEPFAVQAARGGTWATEVSWDGSDAARLPGFGQGQLVLQVDDRVVPEPGSGRLTFGADLRLDEVSSGSDGDNGDNVIQRGLYGDPAQYKLQVDRRRPSCVVRGESGEVVVKADLELGRGWYRVGCRRAGDGVTLTVADIESERVGPPRRWKARGATGRLSPRGPLAIGGKLTAGGALVGSDTDQFNGALDNVVVR